MSQIFGGYRMAVSQHASAVGSIGNTTVVAFHIDGHRVYRRTHYGTPRQMAIRAALREFSRCTYCRAQITTEDTRCLCHRHCRDCGTGCYICDCGQICQMGVRCDNCELPEPDPEPPFAQRHLTFWSGKACKENPSTRYVSAEIEVCGAGDYDNIAGTTQKWKASVVHDGSLPSGGYEINTSPASGGMFVEQINEHCDALKDDQAYVNDRAGLHIHVSSRSMNVYDLRKMAVLYSSLEAWLFDFFPGRGDSDYCKPCKGSLKRLFVDPFRKPFIVSPRKDPGKSMRDSVFSAIYGRKEEMKREKYVDHRYWALNIHSHYFRGTIECRMANGTTKANKIVPWGIFWAHLLDFAENKTDKYVLAVAKLSPGEIVTEVCNVPSVHSFFDL